MAVQFESKYNCLKNTLGKIKDKNLKTEQQPNSVEIQIHMYKKKENKNVNDERDLFKPCSGVPGQFWPSVGDQDTKPHGRYVKDAFGHDETDREK